ncbi:MAG: hypothetical protein CM15mP103_04750 [Gammaproteobacteria bacterium]|nr:MAG: hypothetical protein CM15mP103_04750 [Gammaproteobacteria bacterium]
MNAARVYSLGILAGGQGARWGGRDKGLIAYQDARWSLGSHRRARNTLENLICCRSHPISTSISLTGCSAIRLPIRTLCGHHCSDVCGYLSHTDDTAR